MQVYSIWTVGNTCKIVISEADEIGEAGEASVNGDLLLRPKAWWNISVLQVLHLEASHTTG